MEKIIEIRNLRKDYGQLRAIDDLSFDVYRGEILGLLGPNGSGKSTTISCILSLLSFQGGSITVFGKEMRSDAYDIKQNIGVVFQDVAVFEELTVYENIDYFCGLYVRNKKTRASYIADALQLTGLEKYIDFYPKELSGGLLRRLNIACGIAHKPKLIFFDEPTVAVDPQSRNNILEGIRTLRNQGATIIYTTHYMEEAEILCDRILIIDKGKIIASGTADELKERVHTAEKITVEIYELDQKIIDEFISWQDIESVSYENSLLTLTYCQGDDHLTRLIDFFHERHIVCHKIFLQRPSLNDVFLELTGKELRD